MRSQYSLKFKIAATNLVGKEPQKAAAELSGGKQVPFVQLALCRILTKEELEGRALYQRMRPSASKASGSNEDGLYAQAACAPIGKRMRASN